VPPVRSQETGARDSRAAHQSGDACGSAIGRAIFKQIICYSASMKATITVTSRGVVTLPLGIRKALGIKADDTLIAETTPDGLLLRPAVTLPVEIYNDKRTREFDEAEQDLAQAMRRTPPAGTKAPRRRG